MLVPRTSRLVAVLPQGWLPPRGYTDAVYDVRTGILYMGGVIGCDPATRKVVSGGLVEEFLQVLYNIQVLLAEVGATQADIARMRISTTSMSEYRKKETLRMLRDVWHLVFNCPYPAMALYGVSSLFDPDASIEVEVEACPL